MGGGASALRFDASGTVVDAYRIARWTRRHTVAVVPGADKALFDDKVAFSKANCPISKALAAVPEIVINATLQG